MKIINLSTEIEWLESGREILDRIEKAGRTAYKTKLKDSAEFVKMIMGRGHLSVLEHVSVSARVICDRGVSHEIVRHRIASYTQESTRYCNYSEDRFGNELTFIRPSFLTVDSQRYTLWLTAMQHTEHIYFKLIDEKWQPQEARSVLPNSLKTEIVMTMNLREWLHFFALRTSKEAHPDMQVIAKDLLGKFQEHIPVIFND